MTFRSLHEFEKWLDAGCIILDTTYEFPDIPGVPSPKFLLFLTDRINESGFYVVCLTTSKRHTYKKSFSSYYEIIDLSMSEGACIIECERIFQITRVQLEKKISRGEIIGKNKISSNDLQNILDIIEESERIETYKKEWLGL